MAGYEPTRAELAALFGKSERWIGELRSRGTLPADGATLAENIEAWFAYQLGEQGGDIDYNAEKARLTKEQADAAAMKNEALRGRLLQREAVTAAVQSAFVRVRARLLAIPAKAAPLVFQAPAIAEVEAKLTDSVHEALAELAATQVVSDSADVALLEGDGAGDGDGGAGLVERAPAAAEVDGKPVGGSKPKAKRGGQRRAG